MSKKELYKPMSAGEQEKKLSNLRARAEREFAKKKASGLKKWNGDVEALVHELQVHQVELEMQNDELRRAQVVIEDSRSRYADLYDFAPVAYLTFDKDGLIVEANFKAAELLGVERSALVRRPFSPFLPAPSQDPFREHRRAALRQPGRHSCFLQVVRKDGTTLDVRVESQGGNDNDGRLTQVRSVLWDVTEQEKLRKRLQQKEKMEALGTLAGGIAHEFNNLFSVISINTESALFDMEEGSPSRSPLLSVLGAIKRGKEQVRQIISFSRQKEQERKPMRISPVLEEMLKFLRNSLPAKIEIQADLAAEADIIVGDPTEVHQILMNLCSNASYAMREEGGVLAVKLKPVQMEAGEAAQYPGLKPGPYLRLTVSDTGRGIPPELTEKIFDPFCTTKKTGEGTGMGLAVVHGLVKSYGGAITVQSEPGRGSTFEVYIPRAESGPEPRMSAARAPSFGNERVLLVEDEEIQLRSFESMLERLGYRVTSCRNGLDALAEFETHPDDYDLVITDQTMPKMTGVQLAQALLEVRPDIPVILCTGYSEVIDAEEAKELGVREFVMKPFSVAEFSATLRKVLTPPPETLPQKNP